MRVGVYIKRFYITKEDVENEENLKEKREKKNYSKRVSAHNFPRQGRRHPPKKKERENLGFRQKGNKQKNKKKETSYKKKEKINNCIFTLYRARLCIYLYTHTHTHIKSPGKRRRDMVRTTPARSPSSGVEALLTPNRLNNATHHHHHDGENTPLTNNNNNRQQSGGRKAKTPLKSPLAVVGLLSPNDDTLERQQSMKKRQTVSAFRRELSKNVEKQLENIDVANLSSSSSSDEEEDDGEENADGHENVKEGGGREKQQQKKKAAATTNKPKLTQDAVMNLYANCIKLASENKINAKNTWSLALIDHISDIVKNEKDEDDNTNFQKASCTLEAGVKIYASRVDSFHSETFRMLGGISNASGNNGEDEENMDDPRRGSGDGAEEFDEDGNPIPKQKKQSTRSSNVVTLENPENHTMKVMDDVVHVDPLFKKTSSMFDEGGASGLLLNNLAVHKGCNICFDSEEVPDYTRGDDLEGGAGTFDLSQMSREIANAFAVGQTRTRITPSIDIVHEMLAEVTGVPYNKPGSENMGGEATTSSNATAAEGGDDFFGGASDQGAITFAEYDEDDEDNVPSGGDGDDVFNVNVEEEDWGLGDGAGGFGDNDDENDWGRLGNDEEDDYENNLTADTGSLDWVANVAIGGKHAWAGPSHWHFKKTSAASTSQVTKYDENGEPIKASAAGDKEKKKRGERDLTYDFENLPELDDKRFDMAEDPNDLLLKSELTTSDTLLPPDLGYEAEDLIKLFLKPQFVNTVMAPKRAAVRSEINFHDNDNNLFIPNNDDGFDGGDFGGGFDDDDIQRDEDGNELVGAAGGWNDDGDNGLVDAPRKVEKIEVNYARTTKVVDIRALKQTIWKDLEEENATVEQKHSFHEILSQFPEENPAGRLEDISVHMAFICALHLANEHGLVIKSVPEMNDLVISNVPTEA